MTQPERDQQPKTISVRSETSFGTIPRRLATILHQTEMLQATSDAMADAALNKNWSQWHRDYKARHEAVAVLKHAVAGLAGDTGTEFADVVTLTDMMRAQSPTGSNQFASPKKTPMRQ